MKLITRSLAPGQSIRFSPELTLRWSGFDIGEMADLHDPKDPNHVVPMDQPTSPQWAQQGRWKEVIQQMCRPCKEHGLFPVLGEQFLALAKDRPLAIGLLKVHCPNKECKYYAGDYTTAQWNELM